MFFFLQDHPLCVHLKLVCMHAMCLTSLTNSYDDRPFQFRFDLIIVLQHRHKFQEFRINISLVLHGHPGPGKTS